MLGTVGHCISVVLESAVGSLVGGGFCSGKLCVDWDILIY